MNRLDVILLLTIPLFLMQTLMACGSSTPISQPNIDSLPKITKEYNGYRLAITNLSVKKKKSKTAQLEYTLINTGREPIFYKQSDPNPTPIFFDFDHTLQQSGLAAQKNAILQALLSNDIAIQPGRSIKKQSLKINLKSQPASSKDSDDTFTINVGGNSSNKSKTYIDKKFCPDLQLDTIIVKKQSKKWATVEYTISNKGKGPAALRGDSKADEDNLAIKAYLTRTGKLSRGAIPIDGAFIKGKDLLKPGETYKGTLRLDITKKTKFSSVLVLELDPYLSIRECDETNNQGAVGLE